MSCVYHYYRKKNIYIYIIEAEKKLGDEEVYEDVSNDAAPLLETINAVIAKIRKRGDLKRLFYL